MEVTSGQREEERERERERKGEMEGIAMKGWVNDRFRQRDPDNLSKVVFAEH